MSETDLRNLRDGYKKFALLGIPLYISEENNEYAEGGAQVLCEIAFQLPDHIRINKKIKEYPMVGEMELAEVFRQMAEVVSDTSDFETNILSFWILDMFIEGLWTAQNAGMGFQHQKVTLLWIAYFFNHIIQQNPKRKQLFMHLKEILFLPEGVRKRQNDTELAGELDEDNEEHLWHGLSAQKIDWHLPQPPNSYDLKDEEEIFSEILSSASNDMGESTTPKSPSTPGSTDENNSELNVQHMNIILEILYRIFCRLWVYLEIQSSIHNMPNIETIELPFKIHTPKPRLKFQVPSIQLKSKEKKSKKSASPEKSENEIEAERQLYRNEYILPLQDSEEAKALAHNFARGHRSSEKKTRDKKK